MVPRPVKLRDTTLMSTYDLLLSSVILSEVESEWLLLLHLILSRFQCVPRLDSDVFKKLHLTDVSSFSLPLNSNVLVLAECYNSEGLPVKSNFR